MSARERDGQRLTTTDRLERTIREDILTGELAPGARMKPSLLAPSYGVSVTPFREVLARLESAGLVVSDRWVGARVAPVSVDEAQDMYHVRLLLEREAISDSVRHGDAAWEQRLRRSAEALQTASQRVPTRRQQTRAATLRWLTVHRAFHVATVAACTSPWTLRILDNVYDHLDRYQAKAWTEHGLRAPSLQEHRAILDACLARDPDAAADRLERHLQSAVDWITAVISDAGAATDD
jgi:GntR family transcriptional regulator, carbon starvation induced regulator